MHGHTYDFRQLSPVPGLCEGQEVWRPPRESHPSLPPSPLTMVLLFNVLRSFGSLPRRFKIVAALSVMFLVDLTFRGKHLALTTGPASAATLAADLLRREPVTVAAGGSNVGSSRSGDETVVAAPAVDPLLAG
jgi:hypothetical protein